MSRNIHVSKSILFYYYDSTHILRLVSPGNVPIGSRFFECVTIRLSRLDTVEQNEGGVHIALPDYRRLDLRVFGVPEIFSVKLFYLYLIRRAFF